MRVRIAFNGLWPFALVAALACILSARNAALIRGSGLREAIRLAMLHSLEAFVVVSFCVLPSVTRSLFLAFQCKAFGYDDDPTTDLKRRQRSAHGHTGRSRLQARKIFGA